MTFKRQMEKAIKAYLGQYGFKYYPKVYSYEKRLNEEISYSIGHTTASCYQKQYFELRIFVTVASRSLNEILYEVTNGIIDYRDFDGSPAYINVLDDDSAMEMMFTGERSIEENIAEFDRIYKEQVQRVFEKYCSMKSIYTCPLHDKNFNILNTPYIFFYIPLAYYFEGRYDEMFKHIDKRLEIEDVHIKKVLERYGELREETTEYRDAYLNMRDNLKKWIVEGRQFKVDDEYLPKLSHFADENTETIDADACFCTKKSKIFNFFREIFGKSIKNV